MRLAGLALALGLAFAGCAASSSSAGAQEAAPASAAAPDPPALLVLLVVDQLRADLLDRYDDLFTGGLRRIREQGRSFTQATHDHAITETAPGHASLSTGTHPDRHGMIANQWWERTDEGRWEPTFNVVDVETRIVGEPGLAGSSPARLERTGLADWLLEARPDARVVSVSGKDRAAVLLAGRSRSPVYWFDSGAGRFVTSTWYGEAAAPWVDAFNAEALPTLVGDSVWPSTVPPAAAGRSRADTAAFEGDGEHTFFPHAWADAVEGPDSEPVPFWEWWASTPALDVATLALARQAVESEGLGEDDVPDLLAVSLSQTDRVGHAYGPLSREQLDNLLRMDRELGNFLAWLDDRVGEGRWILAFTGDHGTQDTPEGRAEAGLQGRRLAEADRDSLQVAVDQALGWARRARPTQEQLADTLAALTGRVEWVARAWSSGGLAREEPPDSFRVLQRRSTYPGRVTGLLGRLDVVYQRQPYTLPWSVPRGTHHDGPYYYDRWVPLVLVGPGITPGYVDEPVSTTDVAPTLARLLGIEPPDDLDGVARVVR